MDVGSLAQENPLSIHLIDPAPDSVLTASPLSLVLAFNRPIFSDTVDSDVVVMQTDSEGNPTGYTSPNELTVNPSATQLTVALPEILKPGHYQIWIVGTSSIMDIDGNYLTDGLNNIMVDQFDVAVPRVSLDDAVDLGTADPTPQQVTGSLDFQANPYAVSLYQIHLDPGHFWRLGLEVSAQRDGGTLDTALALFDDQGRAIATDEVGRKDAPNDPYLFAGLNPGTYYIGVSGVNNLPGPKGGYDPATGSAGSVPQTQDAGAFTLHVVADPVDTPPQLSSFTVDHADALTSAPTGLTLGFSRTISLSSQFGNLAPILNKGIEVRDQNGLSWPVQVSAYHETDAKISYLFDEFLPPGHYVVELPRQGGLTDLAGLPPVADGQPSGILGQFDVPASEGSSDPLDLGALLPKAARDGVVFDVALSEGQTAGYRLVVTVPGMYKFQAQSSGDPPSIQIVGPGVDHSISLDGSNDTLLSPGVYSIVFQAPPTGPLSVHSFFHLASSDIEIVLANGVGQGPALSLRLISFAATSPSPQPIAPTPVDLNASPTPLPATLPHADSGAPGEEAASSTRSASRSSNGEMPSTDSAVSLTPPALAPTPADPKPLPTPPSAQPAPADGGARREDPTSSSRSASGPSNSGMPSTAPVVTISFLGLGNDLVGRPLVEARGPEYTAPGPVPGSDSQASVSAARGRSVRLAPA